MSIARLNELDRKLQSLGCARRIHDTGNIRQLIMYIKRKRSQGQCDKKEVELLIEKLSDFFTK